MTARTTDPFLDRDWAGLSRLDDQYWVREYRRGGPHSAIEASKALWSHMKRLRPEWPTDLERRLDLEHHIKIKRLLDSVADAAAL